ncbi:hypothetical protein [uncultured Methylobacterium sp.]|uniref:hypothetical protein n=1 Tax=uncultured Methylobacterium sp. TaxID=157278 RepID=UPI00260171A6|nr:hypothetical protein [uncultured Methylobacterium sp.]
MRQEGDEIIGEADLFPSLSTLPSTARVRLSPVATGDGTDAISAVIDIGSERTTLILVHRGPALRRLHLVFDAIAGLDLPEPAILAGETGPENLKAVLAAASIDAVIPAEIRVRSQLLGGTVDPDRTVNPAELHAMLREWGEPPAAGPAAAGPAGWWLHVLFAGRFETERDRRQPDEAREVLGIMYDTQDTGGSLPRQGLAVFLNAASLAGLRQEDPVRWRKQVLFTLAHEIGHALNLPHCSERGAAAVRTWMNNPFTFAGGPRAFWDGFENCFDATELGYLRHAPHIDIAPGASNYAARQSRLIRGDAATLDGLVALAGPDAPIRAAATLNPVKQRRAAEVPLYRFGEPVFLRFALTNRGARSLRCPKSFDPSDGLLTVTVTRPDGRSRILRPAMALCQRYPEVRLKPRQTVAFDGIFASFDSDGPLFDVPGRYRVTARFAGLPGPPLATPPATLRVLHPTRAEEIAAVTAWDDPDLMRAIYLRQPLLARNRWQALVDRYDAIARDGADPDDTTAAFLRYTAGLGWMQRFAPASRKRAHGPDLARAREHLRACQHPDLPSGAAGALRRLEDDASGAGADARLNRPSRDRPRRASRVPPAPAARSRR